MDERFNGATQNNIFMKTKVESDGVFTEETASPFCSKMQKNVFSFFLSIIPRLEKKRNKGNILKGQKLPLRISLSCRIVAAKRVIKQSEILPLFVFSSDKLGRQEGSESVIVHSRIFISVNFETTMGII